MPRYLMGAAEIRQRLGGISRQRVYQLTTHPDFPAPYDELVPARLANSYTHVYRGTQGYLREQKGSCRFTVVPMIDHEGMTPVYVQVADEVQARIENGDLQPNRPIPSEVALMQEFGIARGTARRAVEELRDRGLVATVHGRGSFVPK